MTRFLDSAVSGTNPGNADSNLDTKRLFAYHHATKHTYQSVRANARSLDWQNQPNPFRIYDGAPLILLPGSPGFPEVGTFATMAALGRPPTNLKPAAAGSQDRFPSTKNQRHIQLDATWVSRLLWHSMAVDAWKKVPTTGARYSLRVNPSSGNLHPTETYLALTGFEGLADGLYHYRADRHALELRNRGISAKKMAGTLKLPVLRECRLIIGLTSIFWRESWKYGDRAYRYCCHDLGHALMSVLLAGQSLGLSGAVVGQFGDSALSSALGVEDSDEAPMAFIGFSAMEPNIEVLAAEEQPFAGIPNTLSNEEVRYDLLLGMHHSTVLPDSACSVPFFDLGESAIYGVSPPAVPNRDAPLASTVRRRRSAVDFDPASLPMEREDLSQLMDFATRDWHSDWRTALRHDTDTDAHQLTQKPDLLELYIYVLRVRGCEPGVYRWNIETRALDQVHQANVEKVAAYLSLEQPLAGHACFTVSMIADLARAARTFGNRGYRYAFFEAGAIGQRLYVGAEALGWNATGIGAFYDDDVHRYLGLLEETPDATSALLPRQVIYHFAAGRAIADPRLVADAPDHSHAPTDPT